MIRVHDVVRHRRRIFRLVFAATIAVVISLFGNVRQKLPQRMTAIEVRQPKRIPNFLLVGAQKAGTTALATYLFKMEGVCGPQPKPQPGMEYTSKEAHFFDQANEFANGLEFYQSLFDRCSNSSIVLDATPNYITRARSIRHIYDEHGTADSVKIMLTLREPVSREISWYQHLVREMRSQNPKHGASLRLKRPWYQFFIRGSKNRKPKEWARIVLNGDGSIMTFEEHIHANVIPAIKSGRQFGLYAPRLKEFFKFFDRKQLFVTSYDHLLTAPQDFMRRFHAFLGLPTNSSSALSVPRANSKHVTVESIPCEVQQTLASMYEESNQALYVLLDEHRGPEMEKSFDQFQFRCYE